MSETDIVYKDGDRVRRISGEVRGLDDLGFMVVKTRTYTMKFNPASILRLEERDDADTEGS